MSSSSAKTLEGMLSEFGRERETPQSTIEAIMFCVRERGRAALDEPADIEPAGTL